MCHVAVSRGLKVGHDVMANQIKALPYKAITNQIAAATTLPYMVVGLCKHCVFEPIVVEYSRSLLTRLMLYINNYF